MQGWLLKFTKDDGGEVYWTQQQYWGPRKAAKVFDHPTAAFALAKFLGASGPQVAIVAAEA